MSLLLSFMRLKNASAVLVIIAGLIAGGFTDVHAAQSGIGQSRPGDIYAAGNTPCIAAHSTVRSLYARYSGELYQVKRASDSTTKDIGLLPDGYADAAMQDAFCSNTTCIG